MLKLFGIFIIPKIYYKFKPQTLGFVELTEPFGVKTFGLSIINESELYACIFGSKKLEAKVFKR